MAGIFGRLGAYFSRSFGYSTPHTDRKITDVDASWDPPLRSTDGDIIGARPYVEARVKDLVQKDGFLAGAVETHCNHTAGNGLMLSLKPDWEALGQTEEWADDFADMVEADFNSYINSSRHWVDAGRRFGWAAMCRQAYLSYLIHGEILSIPKFSRNQLWNTSVMILDPNRLGTPKDTRLDSNADIRGGVEINDNGAAVAYHIAKANPLDSHRVAKRGRAADEYDRIVAYGKTGRKRVLHHFDPSGTEQTRGISPFAPVIDSVKRQHDLQHATLKAAIYQTLIAAVIKSTLNYDQAMGLLGGKRQDGASILDPMTDYQAGHLEYYNNMNLPLSDLKAIHLLPNEDLELRSASTISAEYPEFAKTNNREAARGVGLQLEAYTGDYGTLSYSGGVLSLGETQRGHDGRRTRILAPWCQDVFELWAEEYFIRFPEKLPANIDFYTHRDKLCRADWIGPPQMSGDPEKLAKAQETRLRNRVTTLEQEAAMNGHDWRPMLRQQRREKDMMEELDLQNLDIEEIKITQENVEEEDGDNSNDD